MTDNPTTDEPAPLPYAAAKFLEDATTVLRIQLDGTLDGDDKTLKSLAVTATYWPEGRMQARETFPKPKKAAAS